MNEKTLEQGIEDYLDYPLNWVNWLTEGDALSTAEWEAPGLTVANEAIQDTFTVAWLSGGVVTHRYPVTCRVVTSGGRHGSYKFYLRIV